MGAFELVAHVVGGVYSYGWHSDRRGKYNEIIGHSRFSRVSVKDNLALQISRFVEVCDERVDFPCFAAFVILGGGAI